MELYKKIETAVAAYLLQFGNWPKSIQQSNGQYRIFTGESDQTKDGQSILCIAEDSNQEEPKFTGNQHVPFQILLRTPIRVLSKSEVAAKAFTAEQDHDSAASALSDALSQDPFLLAGYFNASGQDFTIMGGVMDLKPQRAEHPKFFASGWTFRVYAMNRVAP